MSVVERYQHRCSLCCHLQLSVSYFVLHADRTAQVAETAASIAVIRWNVAKFEPLPPELFKYDLR